MRDQRDATPLDLTRPYGGPEVEVELESGGRRTFDLVVGADEIHARTRRLALGEEDGFVSHLGHHVVGWDVAAPDDLGRAVPRPDQPGRPPRPLDGPRRAGRGGDTACRFFAPRPSHTTWLRNRAVSTGLGVRSLLFAGRDRSEGIVLTAYPEPASTT